MAITLDGITLPSALQWSNEFTSKKVSQTVQRTLAGGTVIYHGQRSNGVAIELASGGDHGWMKKSELDQVKALSDQSGKVMELNLRGETYNVVFDHRGDCLTATPVFPVVTPDANTYYRVKMAFITV